MQGMGCAALVSGSCGAQGSGQRGSRGLTTLHQHPWGPLDNLPHDFQDRRALSLDGTERLWPQTEIRKAEPDPGSPLLLCNLEQGPCPLCACFLA